MQYLNSDCAALVFYLPLSQKQGWGLCLELLIPLFNSPLGCWVPAGLMCFLHLIPWSRCFLYTMCVLEEPSTTSEVSSDSTARLIPGCWPWQDGGECVNEAQGEVVGTLFKQNVKNGSEGLHGWGFWRQQQNLAAVLRQFLFLWSSSSAQGGLLWCVVQFIAPSSRISGFSSATKSLGLRGLFEETIPNWHLRTCWLSSCNLFCHSC